MNILILGAGRMGQALVHQARTQEHAVLGPFAREGAPTAEWAAADVAVDFSAADAVERHIREALASSTPIVIGTTGWRDLEPRLRPLVLEQNGCAVVGANFSLGFHILRRLTRETARLAELLPGAELFIEERHHSAKADAPSGSALALSDVISNTVDHDRLSITATRAGSEPGLHRVGLDASLETLELEHRVRDRSVFATGALFAATRIQHRCGWLDFETLIDEWMTEDVS